MQKPHFSQMLLQDGLITTEQLKEALKAQIRTGELIGSIFYNRKILTEEQVVTYLSKVYEVPGVVIAQISPDPQLKDFIPQEIAFKHQILPLRKEKSVLTIACVNPQDLQMVQEVEFMTGHRLQICVAMQFTLKERLNFFYIQDQEEVIELPTDSGSKPFEVTSVADISVVGAGAQTVKEEEKANKTSGAQPQSTEIARELATQDLDQAIEQIKKPLPTVKPNWEELKTRNRTVLVVDDDATIRHLICDALKTKNYNVLYASRGREAVQKIQNTRPDLVILDAMLPEIHGFTICKTLKDSQKYRDIPVMIVTAVYTGWRFAMDVKEQYGANEVMEKPFKIPDLLEKVKQLLDESESITNQAKTKDLDLSRKAEDFLEAGMAAFKGQNWGEAEAQFQKGIEVDHFHPMLHYYLGKCAELKDDLFNAIASLEKAIEMDPLFFLAARDLAILYQKNGFRLKAIEMWERAIQICPNKELKEKIKQNLVNLL